LDEILDNIWSDSHKIGGERQAISYGISIGLGVAGFFATAGLLGIGGLLASLGFVVTEKVLANHVSEKFAKMINQDYLYNIYDFQKRYPIA
jgi:hypothetical protein